MCTDCGHYILLFVQFIKQLKKYKFIKFIIYCLILIVILCYRVKSTNIQFSLSIIEIIKSACILSSYYACLLLGNINSFRWNIACQRPSFKKHFMSTAINMTKNIFFVLYLIVWNFCKMFCLKSVLTIININIINH